MNAMKLFGMAVGGAMAVAAPATAALVHYEAHLDGASESPSNASPGVGFAMVDIDTAAHTMRVQVTFSGLVGNVTASHIHAATAVAGTGTAGVATQTPTFAGFPSGVTSGSYDHTFDMTLASSYNAAYITANGGTTASAELALALAMSQGKTYLNIHTSAFTSGEIRGFLQNTPAPGGLAVLGLAGVFAGRRRR